MKKVISLPEEEKGMFGLKVYLIALSIYFICTGYYTTSLSHKSLKEFQEYYYMLSRTFVTYSFTFIGIGFILSCFYDVAFNPFYKQKRLTLFDKLVFKFALTAAASSYIIICTTLTIISFKLGILMNYAYIGVFGLFYFLIRKHENIQKIIALIINFFIVCGCFVSMAAIMLSLIKIYEVISNQTTAFI